MKDFYLIDTTLRDGEQTAGVVFSQGQKLKLAKQLSKAGVDIIETGIPAMGNQEMDYIKKLLDLELEADILTWNRMKIEDVKKSLACGAKNIHISAPASDIHIYSKFNKDRKWLLNELEKVVSFAANKGCNVSVGAEDASRADIKFLIKFYKLADKAGASRVRYADTLGAMDSRSVYQAIERIMAEIDLELDFHGHNDFGMATANALNAYKAGAKYISCTINGLGERAGNTALEEIVMALKYIQGCRVDFALEKLSELSKLVEEFSQRKLAVDKAIVGDGIFSHESGIHVDGLLKNEKTYQFFSPEDIGRESKIVLGKFSGSSSISHRYKQLGFSINKKEAKKILKFIRQDSKMRG